MKKNSIQSVDIYYDAGRSEYYVRIAVSDGCELPAFEEMNEAQMGELFEAYPELKAYRNASPETIEELVDPKIKEYNLAARDSLRVRWKAYIYGGLVQINRPAIIKRLEKGLGDFTPIAYEGGLENVTDSSIISAIEDYKNSVKVQYMVYRCEKCGRWRYGRAVNKKVKCVCGSVYSADDDVLLFTGETALVRAAETAIEKNSAPAAAPATEIRARSFYYKGFAYGLNLREFRVLHEVLYGDCATEAVFARDAGGRISFQPEYENYLCAIAQKQIDEKITQIYKRRARIIAEINSSYGGESGLMSGFYGYFMEYGLTRSAALCWRTEDGYFTYNSHAEYVSDLCAAPAERQKQIISLFNELTCRYFFVGYDCRRIELSRLICENSDGGFVYVDDNDRLTDFGRNFIAELSVNDERVPVKREFMLAIHGDEKFWEQVRGSYDLEDGYWSSSGDSYYDLLCYYQFAITGKKVLNYLSLRIVNGREGMDYIRSVVTGGYLGAGANAERQYADLVSLMFGTSLLDKLVFRNDGVLKGKGGSVPFVDTLMDMLNSDAAAPGIRAYLFCLETADRRTKFRYGGRADTLLGHAKRLCGGAENGSNALADYVSCNDVQEVLQCIFADRYGELLREGEAAFRALKNSTDELYRQTESKIMALTHARATGQQ